MTSLPGQYEYCPGSDAISWAIRVLLLRGAVTADNSEVAPLKVGLLGLQLYIATVGAKAHTEYNHEFVDRQNLIRVLACVFTCASVSRGRSLVRSSSLVEAPRLCL